VDDRIREAEARRRFSIYCECADEDCRTEIWLTLHEWDRAKERPNRTILALGHPPDAGTIVLFETDRYLVFEGGHPPV
jgi:hypothetical protein